MIPIDAVTKQNWQRMERGLPPVSEKKTPRKEPTPPKIDNQIRFEDVELTSGLKLLSKAGDHRRNSEGVLFTGYRVCIEIEPKRTLTGWIGDGDLSRLLPFLRENSDPRILSAL
ncbi:MAG: hypothetical protein FJ115_05390 [Deltaproteobacteria bacterium]|nr:hypothetical protein [Deltaproteobacteria bacterium]